MIISEFENIKISAISAAVSNDWSSLLDFSDEDPTVIMQVLNRQLLIFAMQLQKKSLKKSILTKKRLEYWFL